MKSRARHVAEVEIEHDMSWELLMERLQESISKVPKDGQLYMWQMNHEQFFIMSYHGVIDAVWMGRDYYMLMGMAIRILNASQLVRIVPYPLEDLPGFIA